MITQKSTCYNFHFGQLKLARPKRTLESQLSVGHFANSVCIVSS